MTHLDLLQADMGRRYSPDTVRNTIGVVRRFLSIAGEKDQYSRADVLLFVDSLIKAGQKRSSIIQTTGVVKALFRVLGQDWPLQMKDLELRTLWQETERPTLTEQEIGRLIAGARHEGTPYVNVAALATVFGFRSVEISRLLGGGQRSALIEVRTAKGGRTRQHRSPDTLKEVLQFRPHKIGRDGLHREFEVLMARHVREPRPREGWHSVRRSLVTALVMAGVDNMTVFAWMGWAQPRGLANGPLAAYYQPKPEVLDAAVFSHHPYLRFWQQAALL